MKSLQAPRRFRLLWGTLVAVGIAVFGCMKSTTPAQPSAVTYPTITITADGIPRDLPFLVPGSPVRIVNNDTQPHRMHLDLGPAQPGCEAIEVSGELAPGESRVTQPLGNEVSGCSIHDHMHHGDPRFAVRLSVDSGE